MQFHEELAAFRAAHPDVTQAEVFVVDLNATIRGKLVPIDALDKLAKDSMKMPVSTPALDIFSEDVYEAGLAIQTGDPDGVLDPVPGTLGRMLWAETPTAQVQVTIRRANGTKAPYDARNVLARVASRVADAGLVAVTALEQEFYLIDLHEDLPPCDPVTGRRLAGGQVYNLDVGRAFTPLLTDMAEAARALGAETETMITEFGYGQFEVNLVHGPDPLAACDQIIALRRAARGVARRYGFDVTFASKPWPDTTGSGLHIHTSLQDAEGANIFAGDGAPNAAMSHAIAGMVRHMAESMLIFAPHAASYRRLVPGMIAPVEALWAIDHRGAAVRVPETEGPGARIEHRTAGAEANPYLVSAAVLAAILAGLNAGEAPPNAIMGEIRPGMGTPLPLEWGQAEAAFAASDFIADWLGEEFRHVFAAIKRQERAALQPRMTDIERATYLRRI
ncbi:MAG: glutamine synthetase family protein [Pseudomonadota bacterium]